MHSEGSSDLDLSFISSSKDDKYAFSDFTIFSKYESKQKHSSILGSSQHYQIDSLISELKSSGEVYKIEEKISKIALQYGLALKVDVIAHKLSQVSHKNDTSYSEKYKKVNEIMNEITRLEENIKKNYNFVDNVIIPQLKAIGYSHKEQLKKYSMMKKLIAEYENDERFYNQNLEQFLVKSKPRGKLSNLSNEELEKCLQALKEKLTQRNIVSILIFKTYSDLRHSIKKSIHSSQSKLTAM